VRKPFNSVGPRAKCTDIALRDRAGNSLSMSLAQGGGCMAFGGQREKFSSSAMMQAASTQLLYMGNKKITRKK
jgi:hypothetical protein